MKEKIKLLIIGKNSFIAKNIFFFLKNRIQVNKISFESFKTISLKNLKKYSHICNCAISKKYQNKKYSAKNDIDFYISNKIQNLNIIFVFLSTRKIYPPKFNLKENSPTNPRGNYAKNKLITEKKIKKVLRKNFCILRISNLIGKFRVNSKSRRVSKTFIYNYQVLKKRKNNYYENHAKDFLSINQFNKIFFKIIFLKLIGTYNVSLGKKVFISELLKALNKNKDPKNFNKIKIKKNDSFYLNNSKLLKKIKINISKQQFLKFCQTI